MSAVILHLTPLADWQAALSAGEYRPASLAAEGFIHCSTPQQIERVANAFYAGRRGLVLLVIDPARLAAELRWEPPAPPAPSAEPTPSGERFPHLYGPLNLDAVLSVINWEPDSHGHFSLPPALTTEH